LVQTESHGQKSQKHEKGAVRLILTSLKITTKFGFYAAQNSLHSASASFLNFLKFVRFCKCGSTLLTNHL